jgi:lipid-binding SYLF domain-containing protein
VRFVVLIVYRTGPDQLIPPDIIANCKGVAIITVVKAGFLFSGRVGSGIVVARVGTGWSAPSAIGTGGMGWGLQIGAELTDFIIILNTSDAVEAFSKGENLSLNFRWERYSWWKP